MTMPEWIRLIVVTLGALGLRDAVPPLLRAIARRHEAQADALAIAAQADADAKAKKAEADITGKHAIEAQGIEHSDRAFERAMQLVENATTRAERESKRAETLAAEAAELRVENAETVAQLRKAHAALQELAAERDRERSLRTQAEQQLVEMRGHIAQLESDLEHVRAGRA